MPGEARQRTARSLSSIDSVVLAEQARVRGAVDRASIAATLRDYYGQDLNGHQTFSAVVEGRRVDTSVLTRPDWLDMSTPLGSGADHFEISDQPEAKVVLDEPAANAAVRRLAEALATDTRIVNAPLYRLQGVYPSSGLLTGSFGMTSFAAYAMTLDLLENELLDSISVGRSLDRASTPLRNHISLTSEPYWTSVVVSARAVRSR